MIGSSAPLPEWWDMVADARTAYGPDALGAGSAVVLLLDDERRTTGRTLIRVLDPAWGPAERAGVLTEAVRVLRDGHPMGASGSQCLLIRFVHPDAPVRLGDTGTDTGTATAWRVALRQACATWDLRAVDVLAVTQGVSTPARWVSDSG